MARKTLIALGFAAALPFAAATPAAALTKCITGTLAAGMCGDQDVTGRSYTYAEDFTVAPHETLKLEWTFPSPSDDWSYTYVNSSGIGDSNTGTGDGYATFGGPSSPGGTVDFTFTASVPEPASWAMMILGVAGVGGVLRRRRVSELAA